jgi:hypothetical protein
MAANRTREHILIFYVAVESSSLADLITLDLLHIVSHLNFKKSTFYIDDYSHLPALNFVRHFFQ